MKSYLNQEERKTLIKTAILSGYIEDLAGYDLAKDEKKYFKMAFTYLNKAAKLLFDRMDVSFALKVQREVSESELILVTRSRAKIEYAEKEKIDGAINAIIDNSLKYICENCQE